MNIDYTKINEHFPNAEKLLESNFLILKLTKYPDAMLVYHKGLNFFNENLYCYRIIYNIKSEMSYDILFELNIINKERIFIEYFDTTYNEYKTREISTERQFKFALNKL